MPVDLAAALQPIAAALLPGWAITCEELPQEAMDQIMPGSLAICSPTPTRSMAHVRVLTPWPDGESLLETLWHELTHAALSPITSQLGDAPGTVMVEEQIVERLSVLLAKIPLAARLAVARAVNTFAPALRARLSTASAGHRARTGAGMDPETIQKMIDALKAGDGESALKMCEEALVKAASGGAAPAAEPDGDEARAEIPPGAPSGPNDDEAPEKQNLPGGKAMVDPKAPAGPATPPDSPRAAARIAALDHEHARARQAANATVGITIRARIREIRQDGVTLPTELESKLAKMTDLDAFEQRVSDLLEGRKLASPGGTRARTELKAVGGHAQTQAPIDDDAPAIVGEDTLKAEGFDSRFIAHYSKTAATDRMGASIQLNAARARLRGGNVTRARALRGVQS